MMVTINVVLRLRSNRPHRRTTERHSCT